MIAGMVIAGGRSVRFGGEKAIAGFRGRPLLQWAVQRLAVACDIVAVNARPGSGAASLATQLGLEVIHDAPGDPDGPLAGIRAGLQWAAGKGAARLAVSPCDVPLAPVDLFLKLRDATPGAAMASTDEGRQPLFSIWPVSHLDTVAAALADGAHPPTWRLLESIGAVPVLLTPAGAFANLNTRDDLLRLEAGH